MSSVYTPRAELWLYSLLGNDTSEADPDEPTIPLADQGIGPSDVHDSVAPPGTSGIYLVYNYQGGFDILASGKISLMGSLLYQVKVSGEDVSKAALVPYFDRFDKLIVGGDGTADGYYVEARREQELALPPVVNGDAISREIGGLYRLFIHRI